MASRSLQGNILKIDRLFSARSCVFLFSEDFHHLFEKSFTLSVLSDEMVCQKEETIKNLINEVSNSEYLSM